MKKYKEISKKVIDAIDFLINILEGGYDVITEDPHDVGGLTKGGIAQRYYPDLDIRSLTRKDIVEIAYNDYYSKYEKLPINIRHFVYWTGFNIGNGFVRKMVQEVINEWLDIISSSPDKLTNIPKKLIEDGILGNKSTEAINYVLKYIDYDMSSSERVFIYSMYDKIINRYKTRGSAWKHLPGWMNRIDRQYRGIGL